MIDCLQVDFRFEDERGVICQLVSSGWNQFNVITTKAGQRRGRMHYHTKNVEAFYIISGRVDYRCKSIRTGESKQCIFSAGDFWSVQPYIGHDFYFLEDTMHVAMYDLGVNLPDGTKDIVDLTETCSEECSI